MGSPFMKLMCVRAISVVRRAAHHLQGAIGLLHARSVFFLPFFVSPKYP